ncbi:hypothetical protein BGX27_005574, partial [Mortierella sp. AM989]
TAQNSTQYHCQVGDVIADQLVNINAASSTSTGGSAGVAKGAIGDSSDEQGLDQSDDSANVEHLPSDEEESNLLEGAMTLPRQRTIEGEIPFAE